MYVFTGVNYIEPEWVSSETCAQKDLVNPFSFFRCRTDLDSGTASPGPGSELRRGSTPRFGVSESRLRRQEQDGKDVEREDVRRREIGHLDEEGLFVVPVKGVGADDAGASLVRMSEIARRGEGVVRERKQEEGDGREEKSMMTNDRADMDMDPSPSEVWASSSTAAAGRSAGLFFGSGGGSGLAQGPGGGEGGEGSGSGPESGWTRGRVETHEGLQVYTVGQLMPRGEYSGGAGSRAFGGGKEEAGEGEGRWGFGAPGGAPRVDVGGYSFGGEPSLGSSVTYAPQAGTTLSGGAAAEGADAPQRASSSKTIRVRRSTFVPGWAVPPRVLLVDDDEVSRKLWGKFLQVYGCTIDVAVDGVGAVNKMNLEKYDLVLMVCFIFGFSISLSSYFRCRIL